MARLPKGRLGPLVLGYGAVGTLSVLMAYPIRNHGGPLVKALWRHWFWLTLVPVGLLFMAAYQRIAQYGWTEERYLVVAAAAGCAFRFAKTHARSAFTAVYTGRHFTVHRRRSLGRESGLDDESGGRA